MSQTAVYLDAVLEPPRSLSQKGFSRLMLALGSLSCVFSLGFLAVGAYPVVGFLGAEVLLLWILMKRKVEGRAARTLLRVTAERIEVRRVSADGAEKSEWLPAYFARVVHDARMRGARALRIVSGDQAVQIGEHLSADEQSSLATRIDAALRDARRERYSSESETDDD